MSIQKGFDGEVTAPGINGITNFGITQEIEEIDATVIDAGTEFAAMIPGLKSFTFSAEGVGSAPALAVTFGDTPANCTDFEIYSECEAIDVTVIGDTEKNFEKGLCKFGGTFTVQGAGEINHGDSVSVGSASGFVTNVTHQGEVNGIFTSAISVRGTGVAAPSQVPVAAGSLVGVSATTPGIDGGDAIITKSAVKGSVGGLITFSCEGQGYGK